MSRSALCYQLLRLSFHSTVCPTVNFPECHNMIILSAKVFIKVGRKAEQLWEQCWQLPRSPLPTAGGGHAHEY